MLPTPSPSASSPESDVKPNVKRKRKEGVRLRRNGKVIGMLRQQQAVELKQEAMDLGRANEGVFREVLNVALAHHLVFLSNGVITVPNSPPVIDVGSILSEYYKMGWRLKDLDPRKEVALAALAAFGSRRSLHSTITGQLDGKLKLGQPDEASLTLKEISKLDLGRKREAICKQLANRAVELAIECNLLEDTSKEGKEAASVLRVALYAVDPSHPYASELASHLHTQHTPRFPLDHFSPGSDDWMGISAVAFDGSISVIQRTPPRITESELSSVYGWDREQVQQSIDFLQNHIDRPHGRVVSTMILRDLSYLQQLPECTLEDLPALCKTLERVFVTMDAVESILHRVKVGNFDPPAPSAVGVGPHVSAIPMLGESCLAAELPRILKGLAKTEPKVRELINYSRMRFLVWLKTFSNFINDAQFTSAPASRHSRALLLSVLDIFDDWLSVAIEAAKQHAAGKGPFASVGFSWEDLRRLHLPLVHAGTVFARSAELENELADALDKLDLSLDATNDTTPSVREEDISGDVRTSIARSMVSAVLSNLEGLATSP